MEGGGIGCSDDAKLAVAQTRHAASEDIAPVAMTRMTRNDTPWKKRSLGSAVHQMAQPKLMPEIPSPVRESWVSRSIPRHFKCSELLRFAPSRWRVWGSSTRIAIRGRFGQTAWGIPMSENVVKCQAQRRNFWNRNHPIHTAQNLRANCAVFLCEDEIA